MDAALIIQTSRRGFQQVELTETVILGRSSACGICLPYAGVSKQHARLSPSQGGWRVIDLRSTNGTFVNGRRVAAYDLRAGDRLELGPIRIEFISARPPSRSGITILPDDGNASISLSIPPLEPGGFPPARLVSDVEVLSKDYDTLRAAQALSQRLGSARGVLTLLEALLGFCFDALPADTGAVLLAEDGQLQPAASRSRDGAEVEISQGVLSTVMETRQALLIRDVNGVSPPNRGASFDRLGLCSVLAVPLMVDGALRGALVLDNRSRAGAFSEKELHLLNGLAAQASLSLERAELLAQVEEEAAMRARLGRFLAPEVVARIQRGETALDRGGRFAHVAVLFCDLRGFTALSAAVGPERTVALLNDYFEAAVTQVFRFGGMVDKFVGDELMAVWGLPDPQPDAAERALDCAVAIQEALGRLSQGREDAGQEPFGVGIGVDAGRVMAGLVGARSRLQYTVIGDAVNLASRLCDRAGPGEIVARAALLESAGGAYGVEPLPDRPIKGFESSPAVCRLVCA